MSSIKNIIIKKYKLILEYRGGVIVSQLFESWKLKNFNIKNRICVPAMVNFGMGNDAGIVTPAHLEHYEAIARGGAGLIIQEATSVDKKARVDLNMLGIWDDTHIKGLKSLTELFHSFQLPAIIQISHAGILSKENFLCPDTYTCNFDGKIRTGQKLSAYEMEAVEKSFIEAGRRAYLAGYDGIEIHACHGYFLSHYLNPCANRRADKYNANARLMLENIIKGIRSITGDDFLLGIRLGVFEPTLKDGIANAIWCESMGIDFIDAYLGFEYEQSLEKPQDYPFNESIYGAQQIKKNVSIPVFGCLNIKNGRTAKDILKKTNIDMVVVGRETLINPSFANDIHAGKDSGYCLNCAKCQWKRPAPCPGQMKYKKLMTS